jgi:UDP-4-amino-4,6-dideoxy-N-acetyl-beta-L-altrosamine transaminase
MSASFIPYGRQHISYDDILAVTETLKSDFLTTGPRVQEFEIAICKATDSPFAVAVTNGTAALHLASLCLLNPGDLVLTTPISFIATSNSILYAGAIPVFVDVDEDGNIDLDCCEAILKKNKKIRALYAVHFSGKGINQDKLAKLRKTYSIRILEDCAHSLGGYVKNSEGKIIKAGSCVNSDCSILSFHPVKHITTGEGGAITTTNEKLYKKLIQLRNHGICRQPELFQFKEEAYDINGNLNPWYYELQSLGFNYRIPDLNCALGISQLNQLNSFLLHRRALAERYERSFRNNTFIKPLYSYTDESAYHLYVIRIDFSSLCLTRAEVFKYLNSKNIGVQVHYIPIPLQPFYRKLGFTMEGLQMTKKYYDECLSIPMYYGLTFSQQKEVIYQIHSFLGLDSRLML